MPRPQVSFRFASLPHVFHVFHENGNQKRERLKTLSKVEDEYVWIWANTMIDFKKRKVVASCLHRKILVTRSSTLANNEIANNSSISCFKIMNKAVMPSLIITKLFVLKTKITYIQTKKSMKAPIVSKRNKMCSKR